MKVEVVEAKLYHCGRMARTLRRAHRDLMGKMGVKAHKELRSRFESSCFRRALLIDGKLIALGGLDAPMASGTAMVWLALSEDARKYSVAVTRETIRTVNELLRTRQMLVTLILAKDKRSLDFARFIGLYAEEKTEVMGEVAYTMVLKRHLERVA